MSHAPETRCPACGQRNRIPFGRLASQGKCGRCRADLPKRSTPVEVDSADDLRAIISASPVPVVVDFWSSWCGPCRMVAPEIAKVAAARAGQWLVVKANTERDQRVGAEHGVRSIPMLAVFAGGREVARTAGARPAPAIERFVTDAVG